MTFDPFGPLLSDSIAQQPAQPTPGPAAASIAPQPVLPPPLPVQVLFPSPYAHRSTGPRVWPVFVLPAALFAAQILIGVAFGAILVASQNGIFDPDAITTALSKPAYAVPVFGLVALMNVFGTLLAAGFSPMPLVKRLVLRRSTANFLTLPLLAIGGFAISACGSSLAELLSKALHLKRGGVLMMITTVIRDGGTKWAIPVALVIAVGPGIGEELLFRGYVQSRLAQRMHIAWAIVIAAVMFGIMHANLMQGIIVAPMGAYWGWAAYRTGSTRTSIICHTFNNLMAVAFALLTKEQTDYSPYASLGAGILIYAAIAITCTLLAMWLLPPALPPERPSQETIAPTYIYQPACATVTTRG